MIFNQYGPATIDTNGNDVTFANSIGNGGKGGFVKAGNGTLTLQVAANYTGDTTISGGTLELVTPDALTGIVYIMGNIVLRDPNALRSSVVKMDQSTFGSIDFGNATDVCFTALSNTLNSNIGGNFSLTNNLGQGVNLTLVTNNSTYNYSGNISGNASLTITGNGIQRLIGSNSYTGATIIDHATLKVGILPNGGINSPIGSSSSSFSNLIINGGTLICQGATNATTDRNFTLGPDGGTISILSGGPMTFSNTSPFSLVGLNIARNFTLDAGFIVRNSVSVFFAPIIQDSGTGATSLTITGLGNIALTSNNPFSGALTLKGGLLFLSSILEIGTNNTINFDGGGIGYAANTTLDLSSLRTLYFNTGGATINTNGNNITFSNPIGGNGLGGLTKAGNGILTLAHNNTFSGPVNIAEGTLVITSNDSMPATGVITVGAGSGGNLDVSAVPGGFATSSNQALVGRQNVLGNTAINGILAPGSANVNGSEVTLTSPGLLLFSQNLILNAPATLHLLIKGTTRGTQYSALNVGGNFTRGGTIAITFGSNYTPTPGASFNFIQANGTVTGSFANVTLPTINSNLTWNTTQLATNGTITTDAINYPQWVTVKNLTGNDALRTARPYNGPMNLVRYAMNLDTAPAPAGLPVLSQTIVSGVKYLVITYRSRKGMTDSQLIPQYSADLIQWFNVDAGNISNIGNADIYTSLYQASVAYPANGPLFLRVVAQAVP